MEMYVFVICHHLKYWGQRCLVDLHHSSMKVTTSCARGPALLSSRLAVTCSILEAPITTASPLAPSRAE